MKPIIRISALAVLVFIGYSCAVQRQPTYSDYQESRQGTVNFQVFYDELSPYGQWVDYRNYGYVWLPEVSRDFSPYSTNGYWVNTEYGWTWVSDYNWGWAPFHYGRWDYDNFYGWFWVPDNQWGPAWVSWRSGNGYYGWAPMRPGMNIGRNYDDRYRDISWWNFVRDRDFGRRDIDRYYIDPRNYNTIINNSTVINNTTIDRRRNTTYVAGPDRETVQRETGKRINSVAIYDTDRPGEKLSNKELRIYRPQVLPSDGRDQRPAPSRITDINEVKPVREREATRRRDSNITPYGNSSSQQLPTGPVTERRRESGTAERQSQPDTREKQLQLEEQQRQLQIQRQQRQFERQQQEQRRQQESQRSIQQQPIEKSQSVTPQVSPEQPREMEPSRHRQNSPERTQQQTMEKSQAVNPQAQQQQMERQQQEQQRLQQQMERQQQQEIRRQERQQARQEAQQQRNAAAPGENPKRERRRSTEPAEKQ